VRYDKIIPLSLLNKNGSLAIAVTIAILAYHRLAFRQPVICLPILSINKAKTARV
jgi:hypothetical protein